MNVADFRPASSPGEASVISTSNPRRSAQRRYIRSSISAQSWESVPPAPACTVTTASPASYSPLKSRASSSSCRRPSTEASCVCSSPAISSSSVASSASSARSSASACSRVKDSRRRCARAWAAEVRAAFSWSSQKPGRCISSSRRAASARSESGSKIVREQLQLIADGGQPRGNALWCARLGHVNSLATAAPVNLDELDGVAVLRVVVVVVPLGLVQIVDLDGVLESCTGLDLRRDRHARPGLDRPGLADRARDEPEELDPLAPALALLDRDVPRARAHPAEVVGLGGHDVDRRRHRQIATVLDLDVEGDALSLANRPARARLADRAVKARLSEAKVERLLLRADVVPQQLHVVGGACPC